MNPRPYLIIPKLILQPTWGGTYISEMKGWTNLPTIQNKKIGQSYELFSGSKLAISIIDSSDPKFIPELGNPDTPDTDEGAFNLKAGEDYINFEAPPGLLIKINQSLGNSFQLHAKPDTSDPRWKPKAESWYYFEPGLLTFGVRKGTDLDEYKNTCKRIEKFMQELSIKIKNNELSLDDARNDAKSYILKEDPWQFVNKHGVEKYDVIDQSLGGIHHSWEEDMEKYPLGNVLYEVQQDVMDPVSTIRSFDQGKIKNDGSTREIHIDDYFKYLDTDEIHNDMDTNRQKRDGKRLLTTNIYCMEIIETDTEIEEINGKSFNHLFVRDGKVQISVGNTQISVGQGHSCFIPESVGIYRIKSTSPKSVLLKTFLTS